MTVGVGDVIRFVAEWDMPLATVAQFVYHFIGASGTTATDAQVLVAAEADLQAAFAEIDDLIDTEVVGSNLNALKWDFVLNRFDGIGQVAMVGLDGLSVSDMLPHGNALLVKIFTAQQRRQSRKYVFGMTESQQLNGSFTAVPLTQGALFGAALNDNMSAGGLVLNYCTFNTDPLSPLFETTSLASGTTIAESVVAYQRRRRPGTGI